ncbi:hypothetical protein CBM2587_B20093 [Cupriavidus taiwanensis]|uniref:Uncharacterized protein n=1 Tax=Cupriavidus taiwanensis TaxID=164546 RepID=A0A975X784_9BURK|nr:hypothetical protein CBM2587_B20093 [Cupriavidus taiwanensis]
MEFNPTASAPMPGYLARSLSHGNMTILAVTIDQMHVNPTHIHLKLWIHFSQAIYTTARNTNPVNRK